MAFLTEEKLKHLGKMGHGLIVGKSKICDWCTGLIGSFHYLSLNKKDACTVECRELLEQDFAANKKSKKESSVMKKDDKKGKKLPEDPKKKKDEEVEPDEDGAGEEGPDTEDEDEDEKPPKKSKDKDADEDEEEEEKPKKSKDKKKSKDDEDEEEDEKPAKKGKEKDKKKAKAAASSGKKPIKKPYTYRDGSVIRKLFDRLADGKWHVRQELFKGLSGPEQPLARIKIHADRFGWDWTEKGDQIKLVVPKGKGAKKEKDEDDE